MLDTALEMLPLEDVTDILLTRGPGDFDPTLDPAAQKRWLRRRARWARSDASRFAWSQQRREVPIEVEPFDPARPQERLEAADLVHVLLGKLLPDDADLLVLRYLMDKSVLEISTRLGCSVGSVYEGLAAARRRARLIAKLMERRAEAGVKA